MAVPTTVMHMLDFKYILCGRQWTEALPGCAAASRVNQDLSENSLLVGKSQSSHLHENDLIRFSVD